jgi:hypothetical protein
MGKSSPRLDALRAMREAKFANLARQEKSHGKDESKGSRRVSAAEAGHDQQAQRPKKRQARKDASAQ